MEKILSCTGLTKYYGTLPALSDVSVNLYAGRVTYLTGGSGAGKSTFLRLAAGLCIPTDGSITVCGERPGSAANEFTAYLPDRDFLPANEKLIDILRFFSTFFRDFDAEKAVMLLGELRADLTKRFGTFSRAMRGNIQTAIVASRRARIFLLDEPALGSEDGVRALLLGTVFGRVRNEDAGAVIAYPSLERLPEGENIDDMLLLKNGTVLYCGAAERFAEADNDHAQFDQVNLL